jgi:hypothetical protein
MADSVLVVGGYHEVEAAEAFHGDDFALADGFCGGGQGFAAVRGFPRLVRRSLSFPVPQREVRAADGAGVGLGVEAAIERVVILSLALRAHDEALHRGVGAVVGQRFDDAEARAAIGAVGERVAVAPVVRVEDFGQAIGAGRNVREHESGFGAAGFARANFKSGITDRVEPGSFEALDGTARGLLRFESEEECLERGVGAFDLNEDALSGVVDPAGKPGTGGEPVNEGAETHALDCAADRELQPSAQAKFMHEGSMLYGTGGL